jgi:bacteriocin-like protein
MKILNDNEMKKIEGGVNWIVVTITTGAISFLIGVVDGLVNPKKCNN